MTSATSGISLAHLGFLDVEPATFVRIAAQAGFSSVGLRTGRSAPGGVEYAYKPGSPQIRGLKDAIAETGTSVLYVETIGLGRATDMREAIPMLEMGQDIGASRMSVSGDDEDFRIVAEKLAALVELSKPYGIEIDLEFMPFRAVKSLPDAIEAVSHYGETGGFVLLDMLHMMRSGSTLEQLAALDPALIGCFQLCDGPVQRPTTTDGLIAEAREGRMLPGEGMFPLAESLALLPADTLMMAEVPLRSFLPDRSTLDLCRDIYAATRRCLEYT